MSIAFPERFEKVKQLLLQNSGEFWTGLKMLSEQANRFDQLLMLSALRKKAAARGLQPPRLPGAEIRLALLGGCSLYPLHEILKHLLEISGVDCQLFVGDYDNYVSEILEADGALAQFSPNVVFLLPGAQRCRHSGSIGDARELVQASASTVASQLLELCRAVHDRCQAEVILGNFALPARHDPGAVRSRYLASDWSFRKLVNIELGAQAPAFVQICDLEFLANRFGALEGEDARAWFESKQPCSTALLVQVCREAARLILSLRSPIKKVLALDLDNTLWGGVVAEDGLNGIEIGDTSPRGEAFKAFQKYILTLKARGVLLAVCSKNNHGLAAEPFEKHPEMALRLGDFVSFKANWEPKSDNLRQIAAELDLGLDSIVFVDDNPAEVEIVRQFAPAVTTILLGPDPAGYVGQLQDCRLFEARGYTKEDAQKTSQYRAEAERKKLLGSGADMGAYLKSLEMEAVLSPFAPVDAPRLSQLINKSNQFNLTTRRRTEAEVLSLIGNPDCIAFSIRLKDRFGDHGLISILIGRVQGNAVELDTWLMSCRVLKRQVEEVALNEMAALARGKGCSALIGVYLPTPKNEMVRNFYPCIGFSPRNISDVRADYLLTLDTFEERATTIKICRESYEPK